MLTKLYIVTFVCCLAYQSVYGSPVTEKLDLPSSEILDYPLPNIPATLREASDRIGKDLNQKQDEIKTKVEEQAREMFERTVDSLDKALNSETEKKIDQALGIDEELYLSPVTRSLSDDDDDDPEQEEPEEADSLEIKTPDVPKHIEDLKEGIKEHVEDFKEKSEDAERQQILNQIAINNRLLSELSEIENSLSSIPVSQLPDLRPTVANTQDTLTNAFSSPKNLFGRSVDDEDSLLDDDDNLELDERSLPDDVLETETIPTKVDEEIVKDLESAPTKVDEIVKDLQSAPENINENSPLSDAVAEAIGNDQQQAVNEIDVSNPPLPGLKLPQTSLPIPNVLDLPQAPTPHSDKHRLLPFFDFPHLFSRSVDEDLEDDGDHLLEDDLDSLDDEDQHLIGQRDAPYEDVDEEEAPMENEDRHLLGQRASPIEDLEAEDASEDLETQDAPEEEEETH